MDKFVVIDLETTGHSIENGDRIIEIGIVVIENNQITKEFSTFLKPNKIIPPFISNLTGISDEDLEDAPVFSEKANEIKQIIEGSYIVAHNITFDLGFLNGEFQSHKMPLIKNQVLDTVELSRVLFPSAPGFKLGQLAEYFDLSHRDPHRALSDAYVTAELFLILKEKLYNLPYETITHISKIEPILKSDLGLLLAERENDLVFSESIDASVTIYRGLAFNSITEPSIESDSISTSYGDFADDVYGADGSLSKLMKNYEQRNGQRHMSDSIYNAFQSKQHALIEAETGTGKSLSYLLPAIYEAVKTGNRIVISTFTIQLQSQLIDEEIPLIKKLLPFDFKIALLKGKRHYISLEKFEKELNANTHDNYDIALTKAIILVWLIETKTGDIDEITLPSSGYYFFNKISTDAEGKFNPSSPWFLYSYYQKAKEHAQKADILITNHALLCTDMFNDYSFIPKYEKIIIDEAHHFETTASHNYGLRLDYSTMVYVLNQLGAKEEDGWFDTVTKNNPVITDYISTEIWDTLYNDTKYEADQLFRSLFEYVLHQKAETAISDIGRIQYRFENENETKAWSNILEKVNRLAYLFRDMIHILSQIESSATLDKHEQEQLNKYIETFQNYIDSLEELFISKNTIEYVKWIEAEAYGAKNAVYLYSEPIDMSNLLNKDFFDIKDSVILTSATLTMRNSFSFIEKRLGLPQERLIKERIESPFSYNDQVQLLVPNDFPDIKYGQQDDYIYSVTEAILSLAEVTGGRMLVLFTSYDMLRRTYYLLKDTIETGQFTLIAQGISSGSRSRLKKNFQTFERSILLGTSSFWEGIDIPGEDLSCLVIARLPFEPPSHPVYEAKSAKLKSDGKNPFFDLALPNAVLRFKQGFGRLIRSTHDRGIVFVCDARIVKARYGSFFTKSIPEVPLTFDSTKTLVDTAKKWF